MLQYTALLIGFLGSFHCVAMCGPIALALSGSGKTDWNYLAGRSVYNLGRIITYGVLGLLAGMAGHTLLMAGFQKSVSILIGVSMVLSVVLVYFIPKVGSTSPWAIQLNRFIKSVFASVIKSKRRAGLFAAGLANGVLPCGFVYLAMAGAASTQDSVNGAAYMVLFGLGTFPAMMLVSLFGKIAGMKVRIFLSKAAPILMIALGALFIYRGVSMKEHSCCHKVDMVTSPR
jgi:sulfite exporter TauE/SafE